MLSEVEQLLNRIKTKKPQYELDGVKNVWIVKPGAKSRGRGKRVILYNNKKQTLIHSLIFSCN